MRGINEALSGQPCLIIIISHCSSFDLSLSLSTGIASCDSFHSRETSRLLRCADSWREWIMLFSVDKARVSVTTDEVVFSRVYLHLRFLNYFGCFKRGQSWFCCWFCKASRWLVRRGFCWLLTREVNFWVQGFPGRSLLNFTCSWYACSTQTIPLTTRVWAHTQVCEVILPQLPNLIITGMIIWNLHVSIHIATAYIRCLPLLLTTTVGV